MFESTPEYPLDEWIELVREGKCLPEANVRKLCHLVKSLLLEESNVQPVTSPVTICGDIHGQFFDLLELFRTGGELPSASYIFMGDYVDRGHHGVETFTYLMLLKARYPGQVTLLRGNHESRMITQTYGFYEEIQHKYGNANVWHYCCQVFDYLSLAAIVDGRVLCVHGGLSPSASTIDQIRLIQRNQEIPHEGPFSDMMWSDPDENIDTWGHNQRGAGYIFGSQAVREFNDINGLELICRSHQLVEEGYKYLFPEKSLITVWSAPNYCYRCGNVASILHLDTNLEHDIKIFREVEKSRELADQRPSYASHSYFL